MKKTDPLEMREMITGFWASQCLYIVAKLGIADHLKEGAKTVEELALRTHCVPDLLYRVLRALASRGVFEEIGEKRFQLTPLAELLREDHEHSLKYYAIMYGEEPFYAFAGIAKVLQTGEIPFKKLYGDDFFSYLKGNPKPLDVFNRAIANVSSKQNENIVAAYDFSRSGKLCDLAGGTGSLLFSILNKHQSLKGMIFEMKEVVGSIQVPRALAGRVECCAGDFFESVPRGVDTFLLKYILHDWNDEDCLKILRHCREVMSKGTRLLVIEQIIRPGNEPQFAKFADLHLFALLGGRERTESEFVTLFEAAGLKLTKRVDTNYLMSLLECQLA